MLAGWVRPVMAAFIGAALLAYSMGRALPHHCAGAAVLHQEHDADGAVVEPGCALCDLAPPVMASIAEPPAMPVLELAAVERGALLPCFERLGAPPSFARGPPLA